MAKKLSKANFTKRIIAYVIDLLIVYVIASTIASPFINQSTSDKLANEMVEIRTSYENGDIDANTFVSSFAGISYRIARTTGVYSIITIVLELVYFVILQFRMNGQTFGKRIMKLKVVSNDNNLEINQLIFRSFIANFILLNIISFVLMLFSPKSIYFSGIALFEFIQYSICLISIFMAMYRNDGCTIHDLLTNTKVINVN